LLPPSENVEALQTEMLHVLPAGWTAIREWETINLDGDEEEEQLLFFRFDSGQVGALILEGDPATSIEVPERLLPRNFDDRGALGQGVIVPPGTPARAITTTVVSGNSPSRELLIWGAGTHLTFVWWKGANLGYGVTQLFAPAGFGVDWANWQEEPTPINAAIGYYPLDDYRGRANLCDTTLYIRRTDLPSETPTIIFSAEPQGLHFCGGKIPDYPFAPEGVVMAYLRYPRTDATEMIKFLTPGTTLAQLDAESNAERWPLERVVDIAAYRNMPMDTRATGDAPPTTLVCVEFAETTNPTLRRWTLYTLRYQPADAATRLPERWTVSGAFAEPPPMNRPGEGYCNEILARNAP
jgi:hypothetical protein